MGFSKFVRKPFLIEAEQITPENMERMCELIGHEIRSKGDNRFIVVNKHIVPNGYRAYVGWWVTQMGDNLRCYPNRVFRDQFIEYGPEWESWFEDEAEASEDTSHIQDDAESNRQVLVTLNDEGDPERVDVFDAEAEREKQSNIITVTGPPAEEVVTEEEARVNDEEPLDDDETPIVGDDEATMAVDTYDDHQGEVVEREL